ncbi:hypothetical protein EYZ11_000732 [Aspergillus tanneri]|uniref:Uncharacterized protein n=1 Tax=Aspergillus tanneri TaxID=1220188 RepID=A0A4S3JWE8_9EURO|nr:hypothetical protein EYZ11_000732 [Aspergillus tanneri]
MTCRSRPFQYLSFFDNDEELEQIRTGYAKGELLTGELKCIAQLQKFVMTYQERRARITDEVFDEFTRVRPSIGTEQCRLP